MLLDFNHARPSAPSFDPLSPLMLQTKIMQIFSRYEYYGGEEGSVYRIGDAMREQYDIEYFLASTEELLHSPLHEKITIPLRIFHNPDVARRLHRMQAIGKFNVWQIHNVLPAMSPVVYTTAFKMGIPMVHFLHNYRFGCTNGFFLQRGVSCQRCMHGNFWPAFTGKSWRDSRIYSGAMGAVLYHIRHMDLFNKVAQWVALSHSQKAVLVEMGVPAEKTSVIHHFYEKNQPPPPPVSNGHAMYIGRLSEEKGVAQLLEAWRILNRSDKRLVIVGEGPESANLRALAAKLGLTNVTFTGFLKPDRHREVWAGAAFSVVPSIWMEPFGMVVLETWANERAIIAHKIGALPELITHGETGLLTEPFQPQLLAETMNHAFNSPEECKAMAANGRSLLKTKFTKSRWLEQIAVIYWKMGFS